MTESYKYSVKEKSIVMAILCFIYMLWGISYSLPVPFFPREALKRGLSLFEIGVVIAIYPFAVFITSSIWAILLPTIGTQFMFWAGITIEGGCTILLGSLTFMPNRTAFLTMGLLIRFVEGIGASIQAVAIESTIILIYRDRIASAKGFLEIFQGLGYAIGPLLGAGLYQIGGFFLPFAGIGGLTIVAGTFTTYILPKITDKQATPWKSMIKLVKQFYLLLICLAVFIQVSCQTFVETNYSIRLTVFHVGVIKAAAILLISAGCYAAVGIIVGFASDRFGYRRFILSGLLVIAISLQILGSFPYFHIKAELWHFLVGTGLYGIGAGAIMMPASAEMVRFASANNIGDDLGVYSSVAGIFKASQSLGMICGPSVGSSLTSITSVGFSWTSSIFGFVAIFHFLIYAIYVLYEKKCMAEKPMKLVDEYGMYEKLTNVVETNEDDPSSSTEMNTEVDELNLKRGDLQEEIFINAKT